MSPCPGCGTTRFNSSTSLSHHMRLCAAWKLKISVALQAKQDELRAEGPEPAAHDVADVPGPSVHEIIMDKAVDETVEPDEDTNDHDEGIHIPVELLARRMVQTSGTYEDTLPPLPCVVPNDITTEDIQDTNNSYIPFQTKPNHFGLFRLYPGGKPTYTPDILYTDVEPGDAPTFLLENPRKTTDESWWSQLGSSLGTSTSDTVFPVKKSVHLLLEWFWDPTSTTKTLADADKLVHNVLKHPDFDVSHFNKFRGVSRETEALDKFLSSPGAHIPIRDKWIQSTIRLPVPAPGVKYTSEDEAPTYDVDTVHHRDMLDVVKASLSEPSAQYWHFSGYKEFWKASVDTPAQRTVSEVYNSDAFLREERLVKDAVIQSGRHIETAVVALMLWSDSTHLTNFGTASLWPVYMYIGNLSKYIRAKPTSFSAHHLAYIPKLADQVQEWYLHTYGSSPSPELLTHLRRDLFQHIWLHILNAEFIDAYTNGFEWTCVDGIKRLLFPRILTYSADYPEKVLIACLKYLSTRPCIRCMVPKSKIQNLGMHSDNVYRTRRYRFDDQPLWFTIRQARKWLFEHGKDIRTVRFKRLLDKECLTAARSAFSIKLEHIEDFNLYSILVPDLLHEFEIGVFKAFFTHLIRILRSIGKDRVSTLNSRYRMVSSFGRDTIRRFSNNASEMKRLGARDFEDLLQCAIPVFSRLFGKHDTFIRKMLFEFATWHALAKLRNHTSSTLNELQTSTTRLGQRLRYFSRTVCSSYDTRDLPSEIEARARAQSRRLGTQPRDVPVQSSSKRGAKVRHFNLMTYKLHALGHYADAILQFGTTDNYSTQIGEAQHRHVKRWYTRVRKGTATFVSGIARQQRREQALFRLRGEGKRDEHGNTAVIDTASQPFLPFEYSETLRKAPAYIHHQMSKEVRLQNRINLQRWVSGNMGDPALKDFTIRLKTHLLLRLLGRPFEGDEMGFSTEELNSVIIENDTIYKHKVLRVNYTTYDMRREQDSLNPRTHADIMMLSHEDDATAHPYWYARIIGVFHARVIHNTPTAAAGVKVQEMEFLWIRWFGLHTNHQSGWKVKDLPRIGFINEEGRDDSMSFGFLDPSEVIRGVHGKSNNGLKATLARPVSDGNLDWNYFYINTFVDRDMFMRYRGGGIGHTSTRTATNVFLDDRDTEDLDHSEDSMEGVEEGVESSAKDSDSSSSRDSDGVESEASEDSDDSVHSDLASDDMVSDEDASDIDEDVDFGYEFVSDEEISDEEGDDELGPEDGDVPGDDEDDFAVVGFSML